MIEERKRGNLIYLGNNYGRLSGINGTRTSKKIAFNPEVANIFLRVLCQEHMKRDPWLDNCRSLNAENQILGLYAFTPENFPSLVCSHNLLKQHLSFPIRSEYVENLTKLRYIYINREHDATFVVKLSTKLTFSLKVTTGFVAASIRT